MNKRVIIYLADSRTYDLNVNTQDFNLLMSWYQRDIPYGTFGIRYNDIKVTINKPGITAIEVFD